MSADPILVDCEGSGQRAHGASVTRTSGTCPMCGQVVACYGEGVAFAHRRDDILPRIVRGDFDPFTPRGNPA